MEWSTMVWTLLVVAFTLWLWRFLYKNWWIQRRLAQALSKQGLRAPPRYGPLGNLVQLIKVRGSYSPENHQLETHNHDILHHVFPDYRWLSQNYGETFMYWWATEARVNIKSPELLREVFLKRMECFEKSTLQRLSFLQGTVAVNGEEWSYHRKTVSPAFHIEKLKMMASTFVACTRRMLENWHQRFGNCDSQEVEIEVSGELSKLTSDAISHVAFGGSYEKARRAFEILDLLTVQHLKAFIYSWIPFARYPPTKLNKEIWKNDREVDQLLEDTIKERRNKVRSKAWSSYGDDFLGLVVAESERKGTKFTRRKVLEECKTMHIVGNETTSTLLSWTLFLLALYPEWQDRARAEVLHVCGNGDPDSEMLAKLKQVGMIINESLRLYPPVGVIYRLCTRDVQLGELHLPKGTGINIPILAIHHDKGLWGDDANEFKPERFEQGVSKACKHPNGFMPFSYGPRVCLGMNLSLIEARVALVMILREFEFRMSPSYRHCPVHVLTLKPFHGLQLMFKRLYS